MKFNYSTLIHSILSHGTLKQFADDLNISLDDLAKKLNSKQPWTQPEMETTIESLGMSIADIPALFFIPDVSTTLEHASYYCVSKHMKLTDIFGTSRVNSKTFLDITEAIGIDPETLLKK